MKAAPYAPLLLVATACSSSISFIPADNITAVGHARQPAAAYDVGTAEDGAPDVHVEVWSDGVDVAPAGTRIRIAFAIRDLGRLPVELDRRALAVEVYDRDGRSVPRGRLAGLTTASGSPWVQPSSSKTIIVAYTLPVRIAPTNIGSIRVSWGVVRQDGTRYLGHTDFVGVPQRYPWEGAFQAGPVWGVYDPLSYGSYYWGSPYYWNRGLPWAGDFWGRPMVFHRDGAATRAPTAGAPPEG